MQRLGTHAHGGVEERAHRRPVRRGERDVRLPEAVAGGQWAEPEGGLAPDAVAEDVTEIHQPRTAERRQHGVVERGARGEVAALDGEVVEHGDILTPPSRAQAAPLRTGSWSARPAVASLGDMAERAFPVVFAQQVTTTAAFYERLGFQRHFQLPPEGEPGYVGLRRGAFEVAVVSAEWPAQQYAGVVADGVRFEMFVYVDELDDLVDTLRGGGTQVLREPTDMPWGERVAYVTDPDGNPVALARSPQPAPGAGEDPAAPA